MSETPTYTEVVVKLLADVEVIKTHQMHTRDALDQAQRQRDVLTMKVDRFLDTFSAQDKRITTLEQCTKDHDKRITRNWTMFWAQVLALMGVAWAAIKALVVQ